MKTSVMIIFPLLCLAGAETGTAGPTAPPCRDSLQVSIEPSVPWDVAVFGEMHGTTEGPAYFLGLVCAAVTKTGDRKLVVALEFPANEHAHLVAYLNSDGDSNDRIAYLSSPFWQRPWKDGRTSEAMFRLVDSLRQLVQSGASIDVASIVPDFGTDDHDGGMARLLDSAIDRTKQAAARKDPVALVLVGNLHALKTVGTSFDPQFRSMALKSKRRVTSYAFRSRVGSYWACTDTGCHSNQQEENENASPDMDTIFTELTTHDNYDWVIDLGSTSASPPMAVPEHASTASPR